MERGMELVLIGVKTTSYLTPGNGHWANDMARSDYFPIW